MCTLTCSGGLLHTQTHTQAAWQCELWECYRCVEGWITCLQTAAHQSPTIAFCLNLNLCNCLATPVYAGVVQRNYSMLFFCSLPLSEAWLLIVLTWLALQQICIQVHPLPHSNANISRSLFSNRTSGERLFIIHHYVLQMANSFSV